MIKSMNFTWKFLADKIEIFHKTFIANFYWSSSLNFDFRQLSKATLVDSCELFLSNKKIHELRNI